MKNHKIISIMLMCTLIFNMLFTFTAFATEDPIQFNVNSGTISATSSGITSSGWAVTIQKGGHIDYDVTVDETATYNIAINNALKDSNVTMSVGVGGVNTISNAVLSNGNGVDYSVYKTDVLGNIDLKAGKNTISISNTATTNSDVVVKFFTLTKVEKDDITGDVTDFPVNKNTISATDITDASLNTASSVLVSWGAYFDYTIETKTSANYILTVYAGTDLRDATFDVSVNGTKPIAGYVIPDANSYASAPYEMGVIRLKEGTNTLKFKSSSASHSVIYKFTLTKCDEDIRSNPITFPINKNTISNTTIGTGEQFTWAVTLAYGTYFEYEVTTKNVANYILSVSSGTDRAGTSFDIYVNDVKTITGMQIPDTDSFTGVLYEAGTIRLKSGKNIIKVQSSNSTYASVNALKLTKTTEDITQNPTEFAINKHTIGNTSIASGDQWPYAVTISGSNYFEYSFTTQKDAYYKIALRSSTDRTSAADVYVNGEQYVVGAPITNTNGFSQAAINEVGTILLKKGENTIKVQGTNASYFNVSKIILTLDESIQYVVSNFELQNENGVRPIYVLNENDDIYVNCDLKIINEEFDKKLWLMICQYDANNKLTDAQLTTIDTTNMKSFETQQYKTKLTVKKDSASVKGFLLTENDLTPMIENIGFTEATIFSDDILNEGAPAVTPASEVSNGKGGYYTGYDINDGTYDIDAIFYDSEVGNQTKVFAYMGVPKTDKNGNEVSASNKVPAVVLVHGGAGYAFKEWVKKWNDRGVAAIAMSLTGDGPDATGANRAIHPYAGQMCWDDNGKAFLKNFENASMYQTVLNVIRAHNLIRSLDTVDANNTAITGISWGGITTTTVIGVDNRFKFAIPCYGTGYLDQSRTYFENAYTQADRSANWDPANFAAKAQMPVLYVNGDSDEHFSVNITTLTSDVTPSSKISVHHKLVHGYEPIWNMEMIYKYATNMFNNIDPLADISNESADGGVFTFDYSAPQGTTVSNAVMYYITSDDLGYGGDVDWKSVSAYTNANSQISFTIPEGATHLYASVTDNNGYTVSTRYISAK